MVNKDRFLMWETVSTSVQRGSLVTHMVFGSDAAGLHITQCSRLFPSSIRLNGFLDIKQVEVLTDHNLLLCLSGNHSFEPPFLQPC